MPLAVRGAARPQFKPATLDMYRAWLADYLAKGDDHRPTHFYDRPFATACMVVAVRDFRTRGECGANALEIIVPSGVRRLGGNIGHCDFYYEGGDLNKDHLPTVALYNDPELLALPGMASFAEVERAKDREDKKLREKLDDARRKHTASGDIGRYLAARRVNLPRR